MLRVLSASSSCKNDSCYTGSVDEGVNDSHGTKAMSSPCQLLETDAGAGAGATPGNTASAWEQSTGCGDPNEGTSYEMPVQASGGTRVLAATSKLYVTETRLAYRNNDGTLCYTRKGAGLFTRPACDGLDGFGPDQFICFYRGTLLSDAQAKLLSSEQKEYALETVCSTYYRGGAWRADKTAVIDGSARTETGVLCNLAGYANYAGGKAANCYFIRQGEDVAQATTTLTLRPGSTGNRPISSGHRATSSSHQRAAHDRRFARTTSSRVWGQLRPPPFTSS